MFNSSKLNNIKVANETVDILEKGFYINSKGNLVQISFDIEYSVKQSKFISHLDNIDLCVSNLLNPNIEVVNETSGDAAQRWTKEGKKNIVILNFASGKHPGGGWLRGAKAQEEDLARASTLFYSLANNTNYYLNNKKANTPLYTSGIIYSPNVIFFRDRYDNLLDEPYSAAVITCPAPNLSEMDIDSKVIIPILTERILRILSVATNNGHQNIILGAWGCGIFKNDPNDISDIFKRFIGIMKTYSNVCFPVYDTRKDEPLFNIFRKNLLS